MICKTTSKRVNKKYNNIVHIHVPYVAGIKYIFIHGIGSLMYIQYLYMRILMYFSGSVSIIMYMFLNER